MKAIFSLAMGLVLICAGCSKDEAPVQPNTPTPSGTIERSGSFTSNAHPTSGTASVVRQADGQLLLVLTGFRSDDGPDLRVWLSPNTQAMPYREIGPLTRLSGTVTYTLPSDLMIENFNHVLIWCEDFSVLFGHAILQQ